MGLKNDEWIIQQALAGMIEPFATHQIRERDEHDILPHHVVSFGVSSYGYDIRVAGEFRIFTNRWPGVIDPKDFDAHVRFHEENVNIGDGPIIIPPNAFALARSVEYFKIPRNVLVLCIGKSTYARCGIVVNVTAFEPEWFGHVTIEISNTTPLPAKIYPFEGIAQAIFFEADEECITSYADKNGKYQGQTGVTLAKV